MLRSFLKFSIISLFIFGFFTFSLNATNSYKSIRNLTSSSAIKNNNLYLSQTLKNNQNIEDLIIEKQHNSLAKVTKYFFKKFKSLYDIKNYSFKIYDTHEKIIASFGEKNLDLSNAKHIIPAYSKSVNSFENNSPMNQGFFNKIIGNFFPIENKINGFRTAKSGVIFSNIICLDDKEYVQIFTPIIKNSNITAIIEQNYEVTSEFQKVKHSYYMTISIFILLFFSMSIIDSYSNRSSNLIIESQHELNRTISEAKEKIEQESREKSEFLANFTHELRTPLNAIIGFSDLIQNESLGSIENQQYVEHGKDIHTSGSHLLSLINDILDYSKAASNRLTVDKEDMDLNKIITTSLRLVSPRADESSVKLIKELPKTHIILKADQKRMKQVMLNLLSNAVKFTPENGSVTVRAKDYDGNVEIEVQDTGIGMEERDISKAMSSFGQLDSKHSRKYEGTGLGLPLTKKLVELMEGEFSIKSQIGFGTNVRILFKGTAANNKAT